MLEGEDGPHHVAKKLGRMMGPLLALMQPLVSLLSLMLLPHMKNYFSKNSRSV
jgi:hypothetical protein